MLKVMQLVWRFNTGGAERMVINFHKHFKGNKQVDVKTLSFEPKGDGVFEKELEEDSSIEYLRPFWGDKCTGIFNKIFRRLFYRKHKEKWLREKILEFSPDIIHIHLANMAVGMYDFCKKLPKNIKVIYHLHSMPEAIQESWRTVISEAVKNGVYTPICVTELQRKSAASYYGVEEDCDIVYNGINQSRFLNYNLSEAEKGLLKKDLGISEQALVVGCVGRGNEIKNYPLLASAAGELSEIRETVLLIAGEIPEELKKIIIANAKSAKVVFLGQRSDTECIYRVMDVFALASFYESSSIVTVEAQLSGVPCVISDRISDEVIISDGVCKVSPMSSAKEWAEAIKASIGKPVVLTDINRFEFKSCAENLLNIYKRLAGLNYDS